MPPGMAGAGGVPAGIPIYPRYGMDPFMGEPRRYDGAVLGERRAMGSAPGPGPGVGVGVGRPSAGERRVGFSGPEAGLSRPVEENRDGEDKDTQAGAKAAKANRSRGAFSE